MDTRNLDWSRLANAVRHRIRRRSMTQQYVARKLEIDLRTFQTFVSGHVYARLPGYLPKLEELLGWPEGACERILQGGLLPYEGSGPGGQATAEDFEGWVMDMTDIPEHRRHALIAFYRTLTEMDERTAG